MSLSDLSIRFYVKDIIADPEQFFSFDKFATLLDTGNFTEFYTQCMKFIYDKERDTENIPEQIFSVYKWMLDDDPTIYMTEEKLYKQYINILILVNIFSYNYIHEDNYIDEEEDRCEE